MTVDKRQYPRVEITWPVTVITPTGPKEGRVQNISLGGAFIQCTKVPEHNDFFRLVIRPDESRYIFATARVVWSDTISNDKSMSHAMGVRFKHAPSF
jgi:Tfp pilus assembly protein PilZ